MWATSKLFHSTQCFLDYAPWCSLATQTLLPSRSLGDYKCASGRLGPAYDFDAARALAEYQGVLLETSNYIWLYYFTVAAVAAAEMARQCFSVKLNSGQLMPVVGLGTYQSQPGNATEAVKTAIDIGYRHIDAAYAYQNEKLVGDGIKAKIDSGVVKREDLFITTKLWNTFHEMENVVPILKKQLSDLQLDYVDLFLLHWPYGYAKSNEIAPFDAYGNVIYSYTHYCDTWKAMEVCVNSGLVKSIGLSNFNSKQVQEIIDNCRIKPTVNQIECHPYLNQSKLLEFCKSLDIIVTAHSPLGSAEREWRSSDDPVLLEDPVLKTLGEKYKKSPAQISLRWLIQRGMTVIPKSFTPARIQSNLELFDFAISEEDMKIINNLHRNLRYCVFMATIDGKRVWRDAHHPYFPFNESF